MDININVVATIAAIVVSLVVLIIIFVSMFFRTVVPTNEVHVVQRRKTTESYGRGEDLGNVYYKWPSWIPRVGLTTIVLPTSIFGIELKAYEAFDVGKVPFMVDVKAFFQVEAPDTAAQRVDTFATLQSQLLDILKGSVRKILASADIESIMEGRGRFSEEFTKEVSSQLTSWGVSTVKSIEFMDIKDANGCKVIEDIMAKKKSLIGKESRISVALNNQHAEQAEINAVREVELQRQEAQEQVGKRNAIKEQAIGVANEQSRQAIKDQEKITAEKQLEVIKVQQEKQATIDKNVAIITAEQNKETKRLAAEATLIEQEKSAEGIRFIGDAKASAEKAMQTAPVEAQILLAKEIGENEGYQKYLVSIRGLEVEQVVGTKKAEALAKGDLKIISNAGDIDTGMTGLMDIFSSKGGTNIGAMLEGFIQTDAGKSLIGKFLAGPKNKETSANKAQPASPGGGIIAKDA